ncbi:hypothetical protein ABZS71_34110 [Streptomyces sp. NPDC005393]|uniref:hypothetical protein n=1 Tax=Streptomyces sp. NPDC005393 TaxID=3157041 RepID=UPI0033AA27C1
MGTATAIVVVCEDTQDVLAAEAAIAQREWTAALGGGDGAGRGLLPAADSRLLAREAVKAMLMELERRNCWSLAEALGHGGPHRLQHFPGEPPNRRTDQRPNRADESRSVHWN